VFEKPNQSSFLLTSAVAPSSSPLPPPWNTHQVAIGVPAGANFGDENLDTIRAAKLTLNPPRNEFGLDIPGVTVSYVLLSHPMRSARSTLITRTPHGAPLRAREVWA
jgi:hypothetical protein